MELNASSALARSFFSNPVLFSLEISKKEKMRRRNVRLSKMLQPKNAVMILNELVKNTSYSVEETPIKTDMNQFKASVLVEEVEHIGYGKYNFLIYFITHIHESDHISFSSTWSQQGSKSCKTT